MPRSDRAARTTTAPRRTPTPRKRTADGRTLPRRQACRQQKKLGCAGKGDASSTRGSAARSDNAEFAAEQALRRRLQAQRRCAALRAAQPNGVAQRLSGRRSRLLRAGLPRSPPARGGGTMPRLSISARSFAGMSRQPQAVACSIAQAMRWSMVGFFGIGFCRCQAALIVNGCRAGRPCCAPRPGT